MDEGKQTNIEENELTEEKDRALQEKKEGEVVEKTEEEVVPVEKSPEEELQELRKELEEYKDKYIRLYAEFENYKKRVQKDRTELIKYGSEPLMIELLTVLDNLEMAISHANEQSSIESLLQGVEITLKEFKKILNKFGVKEIEALGKPFDPEYHHAMAQVERADVEDKTVVEEYRKGYTYNDKVIRPSLVAVSKKVSQEETTSEENQKNNDIKEE
ncbi:MAG: nucleotide exchange factor GrpE [Nitrospirae bacterium]|nr:nucleotide exchange factor GrpE [Nitrospirota bacterium]